MYTAKMRSEMDSETRNIVVGCQRNLLLNKLKGIRWNNLTREREREIEREREREREKERDREKRDR